MATGNAGQLNHTVVLGKDRAWEGIENAGQQRVGTVDQHTAFNALHPQRAFDGLTRHLTGGGHVANGFQRSHQIDHQHRNEQRPGEAQAKVQWHWHLEPISLVHAGKVQTAQVAGQCVTHGQGDDNGAAAHPDQRDAVEDDDNRQYYARQHQVLTIGEGAVTHGRKAAAHADQADFNQGQTNHQHDDASDQRGNHAFYERQNTRDAHFDK